MPTALALRPLLRLPRLPQRKQKLRRKPPRRQKSRLRRSRPRHPLRARLAPPRHQPPRRRRNAPTARKFAALHLSAASPARITSISRRFPAPAPVAASASTIFVPPSRAAPLPAARREVHPALPQRVPSRRAHPQLRRL